MLRKKEISIVALMKRQTMAADSKTPAYEDKEQMVRCYLCRASRIDQLQHRYWISKNHLTPAYTTNYVVHPVVDMCVD
jgi:hypothetical protein